MTTTEAQFSIAEKEEMVVELRAKVARARKAYDIAQMTTAQAKKEEQSAWNDYTMAQSEYETCDRDLIQQMANSL